jgi:hypothetical protein
VTVENTAVDEWGDTNAHAGGLVSVNGPPVKEFGSQRGTIRNVSVSGEVSANSEAGGVAALNHGGEIVDSDASVEVSGGRGTGGLVGTNTGVVEKSYATGEVVGDHDTGGLVGRNQYAVRQSYATGEVTSGDARTGGLVGQLETYEGDYVATVSESFATGYVDGSERAGGLVGMNYFGNVSASYATGDVEGERRVAGLVGENNDGYGAGFVSQSYATGNVSGDRYVQGLVYNSGGVVSRSYFTANSVGGDRTPTEQQRVLEPASMRGEAAAENMDGFDFQNTWTTVDGEFPQHQWYKESSNSAGPATNNQSSGGSGGESDGESGPGMGIPAALLSLALVSYALARWRPDP